MEQMKIRYSEYFTVERAGTGTVVRFEVRTILDTAAVQEVATDLYALVERHGMAELVLDMAGVRFLSSQALGTLVNLQRKARAAGGKLALIGVGENISRMLRITRLDCILTIQESAQGPAQAPTVAGCCVGSGYLPVPVADPNSLC